MIERPGKPHKHLGLEKDVLNIDKAETKLDFKIRPMEMGSHNACV